MVNTFAASAVVSATAVVAVTSVFLHPASEKAATIDMLNTKIIIHNNDFFIITSPPFLLFKQIFIKLHTRFVCF
jgi:hypothetical protein